MAGSPTIGSFFAQRTVVGVGEYAVAGQGKVTVSTYALGSCVGIVAYDAISQAGGLLHIMLPSSLTSPEKAAKQPAMFADTGIPEFFSALTGMGAQRGRLKIYIAGGACVLAGPDTFKIGERNVAATRRLIGVYGCRILGEDVAGTVNRTLHLEISTGMLSLKLPDRSFEVSLA